MQMTDTMHPPAGATAWLASRNPQVMDMSWYYLPIVILSSTVVLIVALIVNNIQRQYPLYWFQDYVNRENSPGDLEKGIRTATSIESTA
jgi:CBS-domain-containing membrane protein